MNGWKRAPNDASGHYHVFEDGLWDSVCGLVWLDTESRGEEGVLQDPEPLKRCPQCAGRMARREARRANL